MPELPEVQTTVSGLKSQVEGLRIASVIFHRENIRYQLDRAWVNKINNQLIQCIYRRAKLIVMELESGVLLWHLGMTGSLRISQKNESLRKHDHVECILDNNKILRFHDPRRFGYLKWFPSRFDTLQSISHYGIEPLSEYFNATYLWRQSRNKKQSVKNFIMNQSIVVGIGNIYACEALFLAGIRPQLNSGKLSKARYQCLVEKIQSVLKSAIEQGGTTISDFENVNAKPGYFQQSLAVYGREGEFCIGCKTVIKAVKLGGRNSFYCPNCQGN